MNKMGVMPVGKRVWNMSLPMMISIYCGGRGHRCGN